MPASGSVRRVRVAPGAGVEARAVDAEMLGLRGGGDDLAAGAHAEREDAASVFEVRDKLIGRGPELRPSRRLPVLGAVDVALEVLDAHAHGEGLAGKLDFTALDELENVAG